MDEVFKLLEQRGFKDVSPDEGGRYVRMESPNGTIDYGFEYSMYADGRRGRPTPPGFYIWSGLGDRDSYGLFYPAATATEAVVVLNLVLACSRSA